MINLGLDVNMHATNIYSWTPLHCSMMTYIIVEFIRHWLSNFHLTSHATIPLIVVWTAITLLRRKRYYRRWRKLRIIIQTVHMLGGSWQLYPCQIKYEKRVLDMFRKQVLPGILFYPQTLNIRWLGYGIEPLDWQSTRRTLKYARALRRQPH